MGAHSMYVTVCMCVVYSADEVLIMEFDIIYSIIIFWNCANGIDMTVVVSVSVILEYVGGVPASEARFAHSQ